MIDSCSVADSYLHTLDDTSRKNKIPYPEMTSPNPNVSLLVVSREVSSYSPETISQDPPVCPFGARFQS